VIDRAQPLCLLHFMKTKIQAQRQIIHVEKNESAQTYTLSKLSIPIALDSLTAKNFVPLRA